jgi:hypothetical protein
MGPDSLLNGVHSPNGLLLPNGLLSPNGLRPTSDPNGFIEPSREKWVVQKFGGTSVGKFPLDIVDNVVRRVLSLHAAALHTSH